MEYRGGVVEVYALGTDAKASTERVPYSPVFIVRLNAVSSNTTLYVPYLSELITACLALYFICQSFQDVYLGKWELK